ncbi:MAG: CPBP family intramembrane metalloprotease [Oscillospiraceae bacterium]|nr:CPBP family intramembrane metalloprotease [Oscillospiraceae bacterium]
MEDKKLSTGAKVGYFFLSLVPFIAFWVIQLGVTVLFMIPRMVELMSALNNDDMEAYNKIIADISPPATIVMHILIVIAFSIWYFFGRNKSENIPKFKFNGMVLLVTFTMALSMSFMSNTTVLIQERFFPKVVEEYERLAEMSGLGVNIITIIAATCLAPIGEELICRGMVLTYARKSLPFWLANIIQALMFGIMHMNWVQGTYAFIIGLILGYAVKRYNSIIPSMIMHFFVNSICSVIMALIFNFVPAAIVTIVITSVISVIAVSGSCILINKNTTETR